MLAMMRRLASLLMLLALAAPASAQLAVAPLAPAPLWNPAAPYIDPGQDEPGYQAWYKAAPWRAGSVQAFHNYLAASGVAGVVPTWQLLRTASSWQRCGSDPFEVPPSIEWPHLVQTLRYVRDHVIPEIGPVEVVSGYRNPHLNICAGGAPGSAHKHYSAIDMVPLRPTSRPELMRRLCTTHARAGTSYHAGLGFYAFLRFHVDSTRFRRWGVDSMPDSPACPEIVAEVAGDARDMPAWSTAGPKEVTAPTAASARAPEPAATTGPKQVVPPTAVKAVAPDPVALTAPQGN